MVFTFSVKVFPVCFFKCKVTTFFRHSLYYYICIYAFRDLFDVYRVIDVVYLLWRVGNFMLFVLSVKRNLQKMPEILEID